VEQPRSRGNRRAHEIKAEKMEALSLYPKKQADSDMEVQLLGATAGLATHISRLACTPRRKMDNIKFCLMFF
jgi:hypothetical protein